MRSDAEIAFSNKVSWQGSAWIKQCARAGCASVEHKSGEFKYCAKCTVTYYCSVDCQAAAWQEHKIVCGTANHACSSHAIQGSLVMNNLMPDWCKKSLALASAQLNTLEQIAAANSRAPAHAELGLSSSYHE
jgi:hypothetical protein